MVKFLEINGTMYPLRLGYYTLKHTSEELERAGKKLDMNNIMAGDITILEPLLFHSLVMGARVEKRVLDLKREDMEYALDMCMDSFVKLIPAFFADKDKEEQTEKKQNSPAVEE